MRELARYGVRDSCLAALYVAQQLHVVGPVEGRPAAALLYSILPGWIQLHVA